MTVAPIPSVADPAAALHELGLALPVIADDPKYINWRSTRGGQIPGSCPTATASCPSPEPSATARMPRPTPTWSTSTRLAR